MSPGPLAALDEADRLDAAWAVLWALTSNEDDGDLASLFPERAADGPVDADEALSATMAWVESTFVAEQRERWRAEGGMASDTAVVQQIVRLRLERQERPLAWQALVEAGMEPAAAWMEVHRLEASLASGAPVLVDPDAADLATLDAWASATSVSPPTATLIDRARRPGGPAVPGDVQAAVERLRAARATRLGPEWRGRVGLAEYELFRLGPHEPRPGRRVTLLVLAGMGPIEALAAAPEWRSADTILPNGQWIPAGWTLRVEGRNEGRYPLAHGLAIPRAEAQRLAELGATMKIQAIKELREQTACGLKEAKEAIEQLVAEGVRPGPPRKRARRRPGRSTAREWMGRNIDGLLADYPLHWMVLAAATLTEDPSHPTMAVGLDSGGLLYLFYNPSFALSLSAEECKGVLMHEINHVIFGHLAPSSVASPGVAWTCACECTANEFIPYPLPGNPVTLERFGLPPMESTLVRYGRLREMGLPDESPCVGIVSGQLKGGAGRHDELEQNQGRIWTSVVRDAARAVAGELDEVTLARLAAHHPMEGWVTALRPEGLAELPWRELIARIPAVLRARESSRRVPSRRAPDAVGVVPGRARRRSRPRVLVAIDTSASMGIWELQQVAVELVALAGQDVEVTCVHCDTEIRQTHAVRPGFVLRELKGGGGTDLCPPFSPAVLRKHEPDQVIYFTDGYGPAPAAAPAGVQVLWVLTGSGPRVPAGFGRCVALRPPEQRRRVRAT